MLVLERFGIVKMLRRKKRHLNLRAATIAGTGKPNSGECSATGSYPGRCPALSSILSSDASTLLMQYRSAHGAVHCESGRRETVTRAAGQPSVVIGFRLAGLAPQIAIITLGHTF
jgi:hypothetical protein